MDLFAHPLYLKLGVMVGLLFMSLVSCALPWVVSKYVKNTVVVFSIMNCLSGGVVLGAALSHMMPDATDNFIAYFSTSTSPLKDYPLAPAIAAVGLILLLSIDRLFLAGAHSHSEVKDYEYEHHHHQYHNQGSQKHNHGSQKYNQGSQKYNQGSQTYQMTGSQKYTQNYQTITPSAGLYPDLSSPQVITSTPLSPETPSSNSLSPNSPLLPEETRVSIGFNTSTLNKSISDYNSDRKAAIAKAWIFLCALSVHSVLEGLGMGAENNADAFYSVLFAVLAHKCLEAFALGLSIYYAKFSFVATCLMVIGYSLATPAGVAIGIVASALSGSQNLIAGVLVSLASGSFLYISLIEILPTELHKQQKMGLKLLAMIFGWAAMVVLAYYA